MPYNVNMSSLFNIPNVSSDFELRTDIMIFYGAVLLTLYPEQDRWKEQQTKKRIKRSSVMASLKKTH